MKEVLWSILLFLGLVANPVPVPSVTADVDRLKVPIMEFRERITKKSFGTYVNPNDSPVSPERFTGYHTGVDVEYGDTDGEVIVNAIYGGKIVYDGWVSGYGGVVAEQISFKGQDYIVIYGHLTPESMVKKGTEIKAGDKVGILGKGYSRETDNERKHLHLGIVKGKKINFLGYVQDNKLLSGWENPTDLIK